MGIQASCSLGPFQKVAGGEQRRCREKELALPAPHSPLMAKCILSRVRGSEG